VNESRENIAIQKTTKRENIREKNYKFEFGGILRRRLYYNYRFNWISYSLALGDLSVDRQQNMKQAAQ
jgi:hypothetical protein